MTTTDSVSMPISFPQLEQGEGRQSKKAKSPVNGDSTTAETLALLNRASNGRNSPSEDAAAAAATATAAPSSKPASGRASPKVDANGEHIKSPVRGYPFLLNNQNGPTLFKGETENERRFRLAKNKAQKRKDKQSADYVTVCDANGYDMAKALQELGIDPVESKKKQSKGVNGLVSSNGTSSANGKPAKGAKKKDGRKDFVEKNSVDVETENNSESDDIAFNPKISTSSKNQNASDNNRRNANANNNQSAVLTNGKNNNKGMDKKPVKQKSEEWLDTSSCVAVNGNGGEGEEQLGRPGSQQQQQLSRSTENLSSFTTVTNKKRRQKKAEQQKAEQQFNNNNGRQPNYRSQRPSNDSSNTTQYAPVSFTASGPNRGGKQQQHHPDSTAVKEQRKKSTSPPSLHPQSPVEDFRATDFPPLDSSGEAPPQQQPPESSTARVDVQTETTSVWQVKHQQHLQQQQQEQQEQDKLSDPAYETCSPNQSFASAASAPSSSSFSSSASSSCNNVMDENIDSDCLAVIHPSSPSSQQANLPSSGGSNCLVALSPAQEAAMQRQAPPPSMMQAPMQGTIQMSYPPQQQQLMMDMYAGQPDLTREASHQMLHRLPGSALPDITSGAPLGVMVSSGETTPMYMPPPPPGLYHHHHAVHSAYDSSSIHSATSRDLSSRNSTASFNVDSYVEVVTSPEEYDTRDTNATPVVILDKGANPLDTWGNSEISFGFDLNPEFVHEGEPEESTTPTPEQIMPSSAVNQDDPSIVFVQATPVPLPVTICNKAVELEAPSSLVLSANHLELISFVSGSWSQVDRLLQKGHPSVSLCRDVK